MNIKSTTLKTTVIFFLLSFLLTSFSFAQGLTTPCNGGDPDVDCPIDSGIIVLFIVAVIYTFMKIYKRKPVNQIG